MLDILECLAHFRSQGEPMEIRAIPVLRVSIENMARGTMFKHGDDIFMKIERGIIRMDGLLYDRTKFPNDPLPIVQGYFRETIRPV